MEVLLREDVEDLGRMGDIVNVAPGYARNYLLPKKLAIKADEANVQAIERAREARRQRDQEELERLKELAGKIEGFLCPIEARATEAGHLFGSVGPEQVAAVLVASGFETLRPANVNMPEHIQEVGDVEVELMLHPDVRVNITVRVGPVGSSDQGEEEQQ